MLARRSGTLLTVTEEHLTRGRAHALIVDLDGTVADTFPAMQAAFSEAVGRRIPAAELLALFGPGAGTEAEILALLGARSLDALERWYGMYAGAHDTLSAFPGIVDGLTEARKLGIRTGMLTGKGRRSTLITLQRLGLTALIETVVTGDEAPAPKPDPRGLLTALATLGVEPGDAVYVGDSVADLGAARAAGVLAVAALWDARASIATISNQADVALRTADAFVAFVRSLPRAAGSVDAPPPVDQAGADVR
jgi:pyrophosphatase PpaX